MLTSICLLALTRANLQDRAFAFLSYKDTIFAIGERNSWANPPRQTDFPKDTIELEALDMGSKRGTYPATVEGYDQRTLCYNVACEDFDHVMCWLADPRFPPSIRRVTGANDDVRTVARKLLLTQYGNAPMTLKSPEVYAVNLGPALKPIRLIVASAKAKDHNPGIVFLQSPTDGTQILTYVKDGWPHVLTVADILKDGSWVFIVGGNTQSGKTVTMWKYARGHLVLPSLAHYETPP